MEISSLNDTQKLEAKDLREILKSNSKSTGGIRADLVSKSYALLMWHVLLSIGGENRELLTITPLFDENIAISCWEERITGSTKEAVQYDLESEAKAVAL